jgi:fatty acid desaturase
LRTLFVSLRYVLTNALLVAFIVALAHGGWPIWTVMVLALLIGGVIDEAVGDDAGRHGRRSWSFADLNLYATLPLLLVMTYLLLRLIASGADPDRQDSFGTATMIVAVIGAGYFYALAGVTAGHELTHRVSDPLARLCAKVLLAFTVNPIFDTYHVQGHHRDVCTGRDAATAWRGEYVLGFVVRTVVHQSIEGWRLEAARLRRKGRAEWSVHNRALGGIACSIAILAAAAVIAGAAGSIAVLAAAILGRVLHEMINYVQHYGIVRVEGAPIEERHAWDSPRIVSNALFYNLPRHADHHRFATKPYWELAVPAESPKLPHGYQTMALIALVPVWWHGRIDPLLAEWDRELANDDERALVRARGWTMDAWRGPASAGRFTTLR